MRILLSKSSKEELFDSMKKEYNVETLKDLSKAMNVSYNTLKEWRYKSDYIPDKIIPKKVMISLKILDKKDDNWGAIKGGKIGGRVGGKKSFETLKARWGENYSKLRRYYSRKGGKRAITILKNKYGKKLIEMVIKGKIKKRELESKKLEDKYSSFFTNNEVYFDTKLVKFSRVDLNKKIILPNKMSKELAEEIGIHLGDGCMLPKRNYFSVRCDIKEEEYFSHYILDLYKNLYNLNLKIRRDRSTCGFEVGSKALCEFKNKVIRIPYGEKVERIDVPKIILKTKNKNMYRAFIRGLFDTDGCISLTKKNYPVITISIKSKKLITQVSNMLKKLGFINSVYDCTIYLYGQTMLKKWVQEINSNNPKNISRLSWASSITWINNDQKVHSPAN